MNRDVLIARKADHDYEAALAYALGDVRNYVRRKAHALRRELGLLPKSEVTHRRPASVGGPYTNARYPIDARFVVQRLLDVQVARGHITVEMARRQMAELRERGPEWDDMDVMAAYVADPVLPEGAPPPRPLKNAPPRSRRALP